MILSAIAAMGLNRVIGIHNKLPWRVPEDWEFFKSKTQGTIVIMGRKTFESLGGRPLPNRLHIIITRQADYKFEHKDVRIVGSLDAALNLARSLVRSSDQEVFVAGGSEIYAQSLKQIDRLYLSVIQKSFEGDAFFPSLSDSGLKLSHSEPRAGAIPFVVETYTRTQ
jgi:dihydrofolate reductase